MNREPINKSGVIIKVEDVSQEFTLDSGEIVPVLHNINFEVKSGSFSIVYGPSGSGKSTLLNIVVGLIPPTKGKVYINGQDIYALSNDERAHYRGITMGLVHQSNYWVKSLSVIDNVALPLYMTGLSRAAAHDQAMKMLASVGLDKYSHYGPALLSGGQQQRVSMARALVSNPMLIVADEPTGNLDTKNGDMIMNLLDSSRVTDGRTVLLVTHDLKYLKLSDQQLSITDGVVTESNQHIVAPKARPNQLDLKSLKVRQA